MMMTTTMMMSAGRYTVSVCKDLKLSVQSARSCRSSLATILLAYHRGRQSPNPAREFPPSSPQWLVSFNVKFGPQNVPNRMLKLAELILKQPEQNTKKISTFPVSAFADTT